VYKGEDASVLTVLAFWQTLHPATSSTCPPDSGQSNKPLRVTLYCFKFTYACLQFVDSQLDWAYGLYGTTRFSNTPDLAEKSKFDFLLKNS